MIGFRNKLINDPKIQIDILDCFTSATLAKKLFFSKYYKHTTLNGNRYLYELTKEMDLDIRSGYFGGRCDIGMYGDFKDVYYYDFTSLYPYVGSKYVMPTGKPIMCKGADIP